MKKKPKVLLAMSGGVDSSAAAWLLKKQGYSVIGVHMRLTQDYARSEQAARAVCRKLGMRLYPANLADKFRQEVIDYFIASYRRGLTPNPCVRCNRLIKFGELLRIKNELGADWLATGHYARVGNGQNADARTRVLSRGADRRKDQSYFLYRLDQEALRQIIFPLGDYNKDEIRRIAEQNGLPSLKAESQDVCFLNEEGRILEHNEYLSRRIKPKPGAIATLDGKTVGRHQGLHLFTIGQRRGLEIGGTGPYYAVRADRKSNILYVASDRDDPALYRDEFFLSEANWLFPDQAFPLECETAVRYRHAAVRCAVYRAGRGKFRVKLERAERAIAPGQSAVFYAGDIVLGGGVIVNGKD